MYRSFFKAMKLPNGHQTKAWGKDLTHKGFILGMNSHSLIKVAHVFNRISFTIINGKSRLVKATSELDLLNTLRKRGEGYLKESLSHGIMPLASLWWSPRLFTIMFLPRSMMRWRCEQFIRWSSTWRSVVSITSNTWISVWGRSPIIPYSSFAMKTLAEPFHLFL